jgi:hypothetical protein
VPEISESGVGHEHVSDLGDALDSVSALTTLVEATELVVVQAATETSIGR